MARTITLDPVTRIEGHLRLDVEVDGGQVSNAWASAQMWRGIETILRGRDPRDAWILTQRFCGVCTTVHAIASIRAVEHAVGAEVPPNAQLVRNLMIAQHSVQDHIVHFYHLSALDWVDLAAALDADPRRAAAIAQQLSDWPGNSAREFRAVQHKLQGFVASGRLGIFGSGYWGHREMRLSPEVNLIAVAHYLKALDYQRKGAQAVAVLGGKNPHIQNLCVGGVATAVDPGRMTALNMERLAYLRALMEETRAFVHQVYYPDLLALASAYKDWFGYGAGVRNYLAVPEFPTDERNTRFDLEGGVILGGDLDAVRPIVAHDDEHLIEKVTESAARAWYADDGPLHPWEGDSEPAYCDGGSEDKYSWCKAPRLDGLAVEVGPVAQVLTAYASGHPDVCRLVDDALAAVGVERQALPSTMGRMLARGIRAHLMADLSLTYLDRLMDNLAAGDTRYANPADIPDGEWKGVGFHEAPRGTLSHWVVIEDRKIRNYQAVVPSTWNASPRDEHGQPGPYEASLVGTPLDDPERPLEVLRTVHSFDPCIACAVHAIDPQGREIVRVKAI
ncbi:MAG: nickel-dependent hydrogenase large subunit [Deferrisomatales bacterium]